MDELKFINSFKDDLHRLGYGHLIFYFLEMIMVLKKILQAKNVANE
jgi:DMSO/TMAO reductase YedYZ heme-binding membrane subunit